MDLYRPPWQLIRDAIGGNGPTFESDLFKKIILEKIKANEIRRQKHLEALRQKADEAKNKLHKGMTKKASDPKDSNKKKIVRLATVQLTHSKSNLMSSASSFESGETK